MDLRDLRAVLGWGQADTAVALNRTQRKVSRFENGVDVALTEEDRVRLARMLVLAERKLRDQGVPA